MLGLAGAQQSHVGMNLLEGTQSTGVWGGRLELLWNPKAQCGFPAASLFQEPRKGLKEGAVCIQSVQRSALGMQSWEEGWMRRDGGGEGNLNISSFGLLSQAHYQQFLGKKNLVIVIKGFQ